MDVVFRHEKLPQLLDWIEAKKEEGIDVRLEKPISTLALCTSEHITSQRAVTTKEFRGGHRTFAGRLKLQYLNGALPGGDEKSAAGV